MLEYPPDPIVGQAVSTPVGRVSMWTGAAWVQLVEGFNPWDVPETSPPPPPDT